ncbi:hypothetical protein V6Z11_D10G147200 [Gossypium hirsutum]|uniref:Uncharacterized protein isoform X3 n=1 Tax=Gossypium hirsutum TaxID=3635 RepID=A0A1U8KE34_GOSHI|nr:uncharacterized protein LOC107914706 isoform X3 [Gossypium hirsutum]
MNSFRKTFSKHSGSHFLSVHQPPPHLCLIISISQLRLPSSSFCSIDRFSTISSEWVRETKKGPLSNSGGQNQWNIFFLKF